MTDHGGERRPPPARGERSPSMITPEAGRDPAGHLTTGWEPHRPLADGLVRRFVYVFASSFTSPVSLMGGRVVHRPRSATWDRHAPAGFFNGAMLLQPLPHTGWEGVISEVEGELLATGTGEVLLFSPWPTPDLTDRGWRLSGHPPLLLRTGGAPAPTPPSWLEIREVADARTLTDWERVAIEGYPFDGPRGGDAHRLVDERVLNDPHLHAWVAYRDRTAIGIGTSYVAHGLHVPILGATLPDHRGRGVWHALMRRRLATFPGLAAMGLFSDDSRRAAEGLGFLPLSRWTVWQHDRPLRPEDPHRSPPDSLGVRVSGEPPY